MLEDFNPNLNNPITNMQLAGAGNRLVAFILDWLIVNIPLGIVQTVILGSTFAMFDPEMADDPSAMVAAMMSGGYILFMLFSLAVSWGYYAYFESSEKQATFGKQAMKIKVVTETGQRLTFLNALGRVAAKVISGFICCIGYFMILFRKDEKGLHDLLANTFVVKA